MWQRVRELPRGRDPTLEAARYAYSTIGGKAEFLLKMCPDLRLDLGNTLIAPKTERCRKTVAAPQIPPSGKISQRPPHVMSSFFVIYLLFFVICLCLGGVNK